LFSKSLQEVLGSKRDVDWGNGTSRRLLVEEDGRGYAVTVTSVLPNTATELRYDNHWEACVVTAGSGVVEAAGRTVALTPGVLYAPDRGEEHILRAGPDGLELVCVFNPPLTGAENHTLVPGVPSGY
jgi:L-ectoine synthase